ncbi:NUDIX hydrolase [Nocardia sp. NPDC057353]|uniref:NUDIX hydrolase n=1 Tax=Nocardia sp. NPDC057353 TaxID=3346104 RepID=UPI00362CF4CB
MSENPIPASTTEFRALAHARLDGFAREAVPDAPGLRRAAVALCVAAEPEGPLSVLLIRRAYRGRNAGQWALPGGRLEPGETARAAALRELHEELGIRAEEGDVIGALDDFPAASGFAITPFVVALRDLTELHPAPDEVHSVHRVGLRRLADPDVPHWVSPAEAVPGGLPPTAAAPPTGIRLLQMRFAPGMTIHAPTGALLFQFREVVLLGRTPAEARVAHFVQPDWTHR